MDWQKMNMPIRANGSDFAEVFTSRSPAPDSKHIIQVLKAGSGDSKAFSGQGVEHYVIGKFIFQRDRRKPPACFEPTYTEKVRILKELGKWKEVALEVMPAESDLVDRENVYHIWEFQCIYSFFVNVHPIFTPPTAIDRKFRDINYREITHENGILYVYFCNGTNIPWRRKQQLKNYLAGEESTAVEIITESMLNTNYSTMIVLPQDRVLDFGLV